MLIPPQIHRLRELLDVPELTSFGAIPLLLDPEVKIKGIVVGTPEESKSSNTRKNILQCVIVKALWDL